MPLNLDFEVSDEFSKLLSLGDSLLAEHGLTELGWKFDLSNHKTLMGQCDFNAKEIVFSMYFSHVPEWEILDTILHEIAHALVGPRHGHDSTWRAKCREIGARPERCGEFNSHATYNYVIYCSDCNNVVARRHRLKPALLNPKRYRSQCCKAELKAKEI